MTANNRRGSAVIRGTANELTKIHSGTKWTSLYQEPMPDPFTSLISECYSCWPIQFGKAILHPEDRQPRFFQNIRIIY